MKILVTYAGSTDPVARAADRVAKVLTGLGEEVSVLPMSRVTTLGGYETVVAGSVEQAGHWMPEAMEFVRRNQGALRKRHFAIFTLFPTWSEFKGAESRMVIMQYTAPVRALIHPVSEGFFTGDTEREKESRPGERSKFKLSILLGILKESDHRSQAEIETWAAKLHEKLAKDSEQRAQGKKHE
jgi:menaquinone-dependent protoporphyrinogen IX oxidase